MTGPTSQSDCNSRQDGLCAEYQEQAEPWQIYSGVSDSMSRSHRGDHTKIGLIIGIVIAILVAVMFIVSGLSESAKYQAKADYETSEHAKYTSDKIAETCIGIASVKKITCLGDAIDAQRAYERDEQDLVAQRQSALWAYIMAAAAVIGVGLSVIGVFLVWTTFRETKRQVMISETAVGAHIAVDPNQDFQFAYPYWVSVPYVENNRPGTKPTTQNGVIFFRVRNAGQTVSHAVSVNVSGSCAKGSARHNFHHDRTFTAIAPSESKEVDIRWDADGMRAPFVPIEEGKPVIAAVDMVVLIKWTDVFGNKVQSHPLHLAAKGEHTEFGGAISFSMNDHKIA